MDACTRWVNRWMDNRGEFAKVCERRDFGMDSSSVGVCVSWLTGVDCRER